MEIYNSDSLTTEKLYPLIGYNIQQLRRKHHMTQAKLAELSGLDQKQISLIESGKIKPNLSVYLRIANAFHVSIDRLLLGAVLVDVPAFTPNAPETKLIQNLLKVIYQYLLEKDNGAQ